MRYVYGLTTVIETENFLKVSHYGNMGDCIDTVNNNLEKMGFLSIQQMKEKYSLFDEKGFPSYAYDITFAK